MNYELNNPPDYRNDTVLPLPPEVSADAWAVDAACSGNPGKMEYRCIDLATGAVVFHFGPVFGTNNIGEFLAIVHALALMEQKGIRKTIYSDSFTAMTWVRKMQCKTKLERTPKTEQLYNIVARAETWLKTHQSAYLLYNGTRASGARYLPTSAGSDKTLVCDRKKDGF